MNPITHFLVGWTVANATTTTPRERMLITMAGIIPDLDGLGIIAEKLTWQTEKPLLWWSDYHHVLGHNLGFGLLVLAGGYFWGARKWQTALLCFLSFHLHLAGDVIGARGPFGEQWPIPYLLPFSRTWNWTWSGQWALNAWPNFAITGLLLAWTLYLAWKRGYSPLELVSRKTDQIVVQTLHRRFGAPRPTPGHPCERP